MNNRKKKKVKILWDRVVIAVFLLLVIIFLIATGINKLIHKDSDKKDTDVTTPEVTTPQETEKPENTINANYDFLELPNEDVHKGNLVLINSDHQFNEGTGADTALIIDNKSGDYKVAYSDSMLNAEVILKLNDMAKAFAEKTNIYDLMLSHTYRTIADQQEIYDNAVANDKDLESSQYLKAGCTELHTGLAFDFGIFPHDGVTLKYDGTGDYSWLAQNSHYYGFILRYPEDKEDITGVKYDASHYRYVGLPHSSVMKQKGWCLEEYLNNIKENEFEKNPMFVSNGELWSYEVYYIPLGENGTTLVPVPKDKDYIISGNNYDGFIVTIKTK